MEIVDINILEDLRPDEVEKLSKELYTKTKKKLRSVLDMNDRFIVKDLTDTQVEIITNYLKIIQGKK